MVSETNGQKPIIHGRPLFSLRNNVPESSGHQENLPNGLMTTSPWSYHALPWFEFYAGGARILTILNQNVKMAAKLGRCLFPENIFLSQMI